ncbi:hypothetical protein P4N68_03905 [Corynebacterium felinum]|uniref:Bacterial membrane flanked domain protein n=2 Tax=Corynebacteriaceae TaxID=1653 RepID=A0ABU2BA56_9CORY|nr:hypothetical protein [Corynebacterium felinum]MDF5820229.1 hypothetical protein [Corynebacterium felinum]MDR7354869.1 hypothetical protein [Corynebacterium felinum]WJY94229.1 hypothetical protein CFELI_02935 [Corynebacterium felinum]
MLGRTMFFRPVDNERLLVDLTSPVHATVFPFIELVAITGVAWMLIGYFDGPGLNPDMHNVLVGLWAVLVCWRFFFKVFSLRRRRIVVTDQRIVVRSAGLAGAVATFPLSAVRQVARRRGTIMLAVMGADRPVIIPEVPQAKRVQAIIEQELMRR